MPDITVTIPDDILKILEWDIYEVREWLQNDISEKARRLVDRIIEQNTAYNPKRVAWVRKMAIIKELNLESAKERTDRMEKEVVNGTEIRNTEDRN